MSSHPATVARATSPPDAPLPAWFLLVAAVGLGVAYLPACHAAFVWDDEAHLTRPALRSLTGLGRIWVEPGATQQYYPLLHSLFWLEHKLWGDAALGYHLTNLTLHGLAVVLWARVLQRLAVPGALFAALLFALHPVQVESVAWISEQKNTLSAVFAAAAFLAYLNFDGRRTRFAYGAALLFFTLGLLTKTVIATLPAAVLVVLWWRRGTLDLRRDVVPLLPWFALGIGAGLLTASLERTLIGAEGTAFDLSLSQRLLLAGRAPWFYLDKLAWPASLAFFYPRWSLDVASITSWLGALATSALLVLLWCRRAHSRASLAAALLFGGTLFPVLGFLNVYPFLYSFVADHFQYVACLAPLALGAAVIARALTARACAILGALMLLAFAALTFQQARAYRDRETLFRVTVVRSPSAWAAWNNLGKELLATPARRPEALACFERALALRPEYPEALNNLGLTLAQSGRAAEGLPHLLAAVRLQPASHQTHNNLGIAYAGCDRAAEAVEEFRRAAQLAPTLPNLHENWGKALLLLGRRDEAAQRFAEAERLRAAAR